uniref:Uncharacterized protein n=1 Tax=Arundo donax TaxID=35708 RepID=A0A0A9EJC0_ARUDO
MLLPFLGRGGITLSRHGCRRARGRRAREAHNPHFFCMVNKEAKWKESSGIDKC